MPTLSVPLHQFDATQRVLEQQTDHPPARLPVANPTHSFWIDTPNANPLAKEGSEGPLTEDADVCIIGSGITGVSAAYHLSKYLDGKLHTRKPFKTVILEARDFCSGATGRNGGHLTPSIFQGFTGRASAYGTDQATISYALENYTSTEILKILKTEKLEDAVDLVDGGHVLLLMTDTEAESLQADYDAAKAAGVNLDGVKYLSREEVELTYGASYPAFHTPGHNLWPLKLVTELYRLASARTANFSLSLHTQTPVTEVTSVSDDTSRRWSLSTPRGSVKCSYVVHATNGYASHLLPHMRGPSGIIPTRAQVMALRADAPTSDLTRSSWDGNEGFEYWFPRPVKAPEADEKEEKPLIILGGGREVAKPTFELYETDDSVIREDVGKALRDFLPGVFPGKFEKGREPEMEWTGIMGFTKLNDPFVGPVIDTPGVEDFQGQFIAAGYSGHGMPRAYACAEAIVGMITPEITKEPWKLPEWLPKHYLTWERE